MQLMEKTFTVILTDKEVDAIATALHSAYASLNVEKQPVMAEDKAMYRALRNSFGNLVNRVFMGQDA